MDFIKYTGKPFPFREPEGRVALVIEVEKTRYTKSLLNIRRPGDVTAPLGIAGAWQTEGLVFNVKVSLCCGAVLAYCLAV